jgi:hypothetical protein
LPRDLVLVFACVRVNAYEAYSVEKLIDTADFDREAVDDRIRLTVMFEEYYHTRFLLSVADLFGLKVDFTPPPPLPVRAVVAGLGRLPERVAHPLTLTSEIVGLALFAALLERTGEVFAADGEIRDAIESRICEVITDELGHISYNRLKLGPHGLRVARMLLPVVAAGTRGSLPGTEAIGLCPFPSSAIRDLSVDRFPAEVRARAFLA